MSRTNDIHSEMWSTEEFAELTPHARLLYIWSFTNAGCGMSGLYKVARREIAFATGLTLDEARIALEELSAARFVLYADGVMFVRARVKHLRMKTRQIARSIATSVHRLPVDHPMRVAFIEEYGNADWLQEDLFPDEDSAPKKVSQEAPQEPPRGSTASPTQESETLTGKGKGRGKGTGVVGESTTGDGRARIAKGVASGVLHPALLDVLDILTEVKRSHPDLQIEEASIDSACRAKADGNPVDAAHTVAMWMHAGTHRSSIASTLLHSALSQQREERARVDKAASSGVRPISSVTRRSSAADEIARREEAAEAQLAREAAEAAERAA